MAWKVQGLGLPEAMEGLFADARVLGTLGFRV